MRRITFIFSVFFLIPIFAQSIDLKKLSYEPVQQVPTTLNPTNVHDAGNFDNKTYGDELNLSFRVLTQVIAAQWTLFNMITPIAYDPISKAIVISIANYGASGNDLAGTITLYISTNFGQTWSTKGVYSKVGEVPVLASVAILNSEKSQNLNSLSYVVFTPFYRKDISGEYRASGGLYTISTPSGNENIDFLYPGNLAGYRWWVSRMTSHVTSDGAFSYNVGMLSSSETSQYGQYGFSAFSLSDYDFLFQGCPTSWALSKFRNSDQLTSTYNSNMLLDVDNKGNVYAGVFNFFQPNVGDRDRVPGVSKSTDYGVTWGEFQPMPVSVLTDYYATWGGDNGFIVLPYEPNAFVVTGEDEYSLFTRVAIFNGNNLVAAHIIEGNYSGGLWTISKVADWSALATLIISDVNNDPNLVKDSLYRSFMGMELQAAKTEDGKYIVLKWLDYIDKPIVINPPVTISDGAQVLDTLPTNDVFFSYRDRTQGYWIPPINVTDDTVYNKVTWIPSIVPSLDKIPLIMERTRPITSQNPNNPRLSYPNFIQQLIIDAPQDVLFTSVSLTGSPGNVEEQIQTNFYLKDAQPNPAFDNYIEIGFVLDKPMDISLELFDALGNKVKTLYHGFANSGIHAVVLNSSELTSGTYYYRLITANGTSVTKQLNIIK